MQKKSKISIFIIGLVIVLASIGLSYAYWKTTIMGDKGNNVTSGCFNIEMINQKDEITLGSTFPITDAEGLKLKPFSFTLKNTCTIFAHYYVNMEMLEGTTLNSKFVAVRVNNEAINTLDTYNIANTTINTSTESRTIAEGYLGADEEVDYTVSFWMDEDATIDDDVMNKVFKSKIVINSEPGKYDPVSAGYDTLHDAILANEYQTTPEDALKKIVVKGKPDFSKTAPTIIFSELTDENTIIKSYIKPSENAINIDSATDQLSTNDTFLTLYKTMTHDSSSGIYYLSDAINTDPTTIDYSSNQKYYINVEYIAINQSNQKLYTWKNNQGSVIYMVVGATKSNGKSSWNSVEYDSITYDLQVKELSNVTDVDEKSDKGLYETDDNDGKVYYYRGDVKNNNVSFAGLKWQIVRINGDKSIRLIYNEDNTANVQYNLNYKEPKASYYMFGTDNSTIETILKNENDSNIKKYIDNWYEANIKDYNCYLADSYFCVDRQLNKGDGLSTDSDSFYQAAYRIDNYEPTLICGSKNDLFTTNSSNKGNKALKYPIGLLTADEAQLAGLGKTANNKTWIYYKDTFWTMTPSLYTALWGSSEVYTVGETGLIVAYGDTSRGYDVRPVINLKSDVKITGGTGTANDPFVVDTNN